MSGSGQRALPANGVGEREGGEVLLIEAEREGEGKGSEKRLHNVLNPKEGLCVLGEEEKEKLVRELGSLQ